MLWRNEERPANRKIATLKRDIVNKSHTGLRFVQGTSAILSKRKWSLEIRAGDVKEQLFSQLWTEVGKLVLLCNKLKTSKFLTHINSYPFLILILDHLQLHRHKFVNRVKFSIATKFHKRRKPFINSKNKRCMLKCRYALNGVDMGPLFWVLWERNGVDCISRPLKKSPANQLRSRCKLRSYFTTPHD